MGGIVTEVQQLQKIHATSCETMVILLSLNNEKMETLTTLMAAVLHAKLSQDGLALTMQT